jgi:hypothetical protein
MCWLLGKRKMVNKFGLLGGLFAVLGFVFASIGNVAVADSDSKRFNQRVAGSYLIRHDTTGSRDVLTVNADGTFLMTSSDSGVFNFGNSQGAWKRTGRRTIAAKVVNFDFDDNGVGITRFKIRFDRRYKSVSGRFSGVVIDAVDPDPLEEETVLFQFSDSFSGQGISAD